MLLEPSLKVLFIKFGWGATFKSQRMEVSYITLEVASRSQHGGGSGAGLGGGHGRGGIGLNLRLLCSIVYWLERDFF